MIAVLRDALDCIERYRLDRSDRGRRHYREAEEWFTANQAHWPFSFECICAALDLNSNAVRRSLQIAP